MKRQKDKEKNKTNEVFCLGTQPEHPRDRLRRNTKNTVEKTPEENEVFYLGTQPEHPRNRFRRKLKNRLKKRQNMRLFTWVLDLNILETGLEEKQKNRPKKETDDEVVYL